MKIKPAQIGEAVANVLRGSWRPSPPPPTISREELELATESLLTTGAGALGWWRLRASSLEATPAAQQLQDAYRLHTLQDMQHESEIETALNWLEAERIESILVKGWTIARHYPEAGLRPYGDIDLCVHPKDYARCLEALIAKQPAEVNVDLHEGFRKFDESFWEELYSRSELVEVGRVKARVLSSEDHLRLLCFHFLREGGWRPLWLCDIAVALETRNSDFDWGLFLGKDRRRIGWMAGALLLAQRLLGVSLEGVPLEITRRKLPRWLAPCVLKEWGSPTMPKRHNSPMSNLRTLPMRTLKAIPSHWPNPIEASIGVSAPLNNFPRLPFQLGTCVRRTIEYVRKPVDAANDGSSPAAKS